jgi:hypothetical protein
LAISFKFYRVHNNDGEVTTHGADPNRFAPPWDLWAQMIHGIRLSFNNASKNVYEKSGNAYRMGLLARIFRYCSQNAGTNMDSVFFTPVTNEEKYSSMGEDADLQWGAAGAEYPSIQARAERWLAGNTDTAQRTITKLIPFSVLFGMPDVVFRNANSVQLAIDWLPKSQGQWTWAADANSLVAGLLEQSTRRANSQPVGVAPNGADEHKVVITGCHIVRDRYTIDPQLSTKRAAEKAVGAVDRLAFIDTDVVQRQYTPGSVITINGVENLDAVAIFQPAIVHNHSDEEHYHNGAAAIANVRAMTSHTHMLLGSTATGPDDEIPERADSLRGGTTGTLPGFSTVRISYGNITYPDSPLIMTETYTLDPTQLYTEYLKACGKLARRDIAPFVPMATFQTVCPFIMLRPFADGAPRPSGQKQDLTIRLTGGEAGNIYIAIFKLVSFRMTPDGATRELTF